MCVLREVVVQLAQLFSVSVTFSLTVNFHYCPLKPRKHKTALHEYVSTKTGSKSPGNLLYNILMIMWGEFFQFTMKQFKIWWHEWVAFVATAFVYSPLAHWGHKSPVCSVFVTMLDWNTDLSVSSVAAIVSTYRLLTQPLSSRSNVKDDGNFLAWETVRNMHGVLFEEHQRGWHSCVMHGGNWDQGFSLLGLCCFVARLEKMCPVKSFVFYIKCEWRTWKIRINIWTLERF